MLSVTYHSLRVLLNLEEDAEKGISDNNILSLLLLSYLCHSPFKVCYTLFCRSIWNILFVAVNIERYRLMETFETSVIPVIELPKSKYTRMFIE